MDLVQFIEELSEREDVGTRGSYIKKRLCDDKYFNAYEPLNQKIQDNETIFKEPVIKRY
jgi:hypothetical protein